MTFTPYQVVIKDFKNPQNVLSTGTVDDITRLYKFNNFGSSPFPPIRATCSEKGCFGKAGSDLADSNWYWGQSNSAWPSKGFGTD